MHVYHVPKDNDVNTDPAALRSDAARNRARIVDAARDLFARDGLEVSLRQIARHAGVGEPTLRRRFSSRQALLDEVFADKVGVYADLADAACEDPDPARGFRQFLERVLDMQVADRGFADLLTMTFPKDLRCGQHRQRSYVAIERLVARARAAGVVRGEFVAEDVVLLLLAHAGVVSGSGDVAAARSARLRAYLFAAFGLPQTEPLPDAPSATQVDSALQALHASDAPAGAASAAAVPTDAEQPAVPPQLIVLAPGSSDGDAGMCNLDGVCQ